MELVVDGYSRHHFNFAGWVYFCFLYYGAISVWVYAATRSRKSPDIACIPTTNSVESYGPPLEASPMISDQPVAVLPTADEPSEDDDLPAIPALDPPPMVFAADELDNELVVFLRHHRFSRKFIQAVVVDFGACDMGDLQLIVSDDDVKRELLQAAPDSYGEVQRLTATMMMMMDRPQGSHRGDANPASWTVHYAVTDEDDDEDEDQVSHEDEDNDEDMNDNDEDDENASLSSFQMMVMEEEGPPLPNVGVDCCLREWLQNHRFSDALIRALYNDFGAYVVSDLFLIFEDYDLFVEFNRFFEPFYAELGRLLTVLKCEFPDISLFDDKRFCYWEYLALRERL